METYATSVASQKVHEVGVFQRYIHSIGYPHLSLVHNKREFIVA